MFQEKGRVDTRFVSDLRSPVGDFHVGTQPDFQGPDELGKPISLLFAGYLVHTSFW